MEKYSLDTPALLLNEEILKRNIQEMQEISNILGVYLRPMIKTHKSPYLAYMQIEAGAKGIMVSTFKEAEIFISHGINDVVIAYPLLDAGKINKLNDLASRATLTVTVDSSEAVDALRKHINPKLSIKVLIKINSGLNRLGISPDDYKKLHFLAEKISLTRGLSLEGVSTHGGHVYRCANLEEVRKVALEEKEAVLTAKKILEERFPISTVALGSTPTVKQLKEAEGITEVRPGNYIFNDNIQVALGVAKIEQCALTILSTVISRPEKNRVIIDAGSKSLGLDKGAHGLSLVQGFGRILGHKSCTLVSLSEELGVIDIKEDSGLRPGDKIEIIPNHACTAVNLFQEITVIREGKVAGKIPVLARH